MKRLWIAAAFLSIVAGFCIWGQLTVDVRTRELTDLVASARSAAEGKDFETALAHAETLADHWAKDYLLFSALMQHNDLHDLNVCINMIPNYAVEKDQKEYLDTCDEAVVYIEHIRESERISWGNVF